MKRLHLFEFEDFRWFPSWLRDCMTQYIVAIHKMLGSANDLTKLTSKALNNSERQMIYDLCSGGGGPMIEVQQNLKANFKNIRLILSDLYPSRTAANKINNSKIEGVSYLEDSLDATKMDNSKKGVRTLVCSMHHMKPKVAREILKSARDARQPICVYEISDNSFPKWIWWIAFPINILTVLIFSLKVRPMSWQQIVFTYLIPILPILIAWDGSVSNARTYTLQDMDELLDGLEDNNYKWETGTIKGKFGNKLYLLGLPSS